jgi:ATP-dependent DNA helicase DinG
LGLVSTRMAIVTTTVKDFDSAQDNLAASLPGYERRQKQADLAHKIEDVIAGRTDQRHALLQAPTGTGKSLAYLIPSILSGKRVVVSTATKALQDQLANKDLPFLAEHLGVPFTHAILKGRSNYLCRAELARIEDDNPALHASIVAKLDALWDDPSNYAEQDDVGVEDKDWRKLTIGSGDCPGKSQCPFGEICFSEKAKANAREAQVIVVNHALLLTDLWLSEATGDQATMLGDYDILIMDEAHELPDYATSVWGVTLRESTLISIGDESVSFLGKLGSDKARELAGVVLEYSNTINSLWLDLEEGRLRPHNITALGDKLVAAHEGLQNMHNLLTDASRTIDDGDRTDGKPPRTPDQIRKLKASYQRLNRRYANTMGAVANLIVAPFEDQVRWVEMESRFARGGKVTQAKVIQSQPITVGPILDRELWRTGRQCRMCGGRGKNELGTLCKRCGGRRTKPDVITLSLSATLSIDGSFTYVAGQLGLSDYTTFDIGSPFSFETQARLYIPENLPEPTPANRLAWETLSLVEIRELIKASRGRALVLFTSTKQMKAAYTLLSPELPYTCLVQGQGSNKELAARFMADVDSVLFATRSFMTGVDFQGATCSLVVIDKLPFAVPTDPVIEARCELIEARGGNTFADFTIPMMTLVLQQAFGRLIRHSNDTGVVAILDRRLTSKGYGKKIVQSLPPAPLATQLSEVQEFFDARMSV